MDVSHEVLLSDQSTSPNALQQWLVDYIAKLLKLSTDSVDIDEQLVFLGLSSIQAVTLTADLEKHLERSVDPAVLWECPTIRRLAHRLSAD